MAPILERLTGWTLPLVTAGVALMALLAVAGAGPAFRTELVDLATAFTLIRWGSILALVAMVLALALLLPAGNRVFRVLLAIIVLAIAIPAAWVPWSLRQQARTVPPIHDISTDTENPPVFVAVAEARGPGDNDPAYPGERAAALQREAYPDIVPLALDVTVEHALDAAIMVMREFGWEVIDVDRDEGRVEATAQTFWFGFEDDVVVRVRPRDTGARVDVRSASRLGVSDLGVNAERVREFSERLPDALERVAEPYGEPLPDEESLQTLGMDPADVPAT